VDHGYGFWFVAKIFSTKQDQVTKKNCRLQVPRDAAGGKFFVLFEFTIENSQISLHQTHDAPIFAKSARLLS
jgi:hypothetical protein